MDNSKLEWLLLIFLVTPVINAWWDSVHGEVHHFRSFLIRGAVITVMAIFFGFLIPNRWEYLNVWYSQNLWWVYAIIGYNVEFALFDYLYNWFTGNKWNYIGDPKYHGDDWTYKIYEKIPDYGMLFLKFMFLPAVTVGILFQMDFL